MLRSSNAAIFGYTDKNIFNVLEDIKYVDLCILIRRYVGDTADTALLGEVEGNKSHKLLGSSGWGKKSSMCLFGIGVRRGAPEVTVQNLRLENSVKTIAILGSKHFVIDDFHAAIGIMEVFLSMNSNHKVTTVVGQSEVIDIIRTYWYRPVEDLIEVLRTFIHRVERASVGINPITLQSVPKIIS